MKITIDVSDFWLEEEELETGLKNSIKNSVVQEIKNSIKEKVEQTITQVIKEEVDAQLHTHVKALVSEIMATSMVKNPDSYNNDKPVITLEEYVKYKFEKDTGYSNPNENITKLAKQFGQQLRDRYDLLFASQLVVKMNEAGLLKEDVAKNLLESGK